MQSIFKAMVRRLKPSNCSFFIHKDGSHAEHESMKTWAESLGFRKYDIDWISERSKGIKYKKTEWDKIKHDHYKIIDDKYRKK